MDMCEEYVERQISGTELEDEDGKQSSWWEDGFCGQAMSEWRRERCLVCSFRGVVWLLSLCFPRELLVTRDITFQSRQLSLGWLARLPRVW